MNCVSFLSKKYFQWRYTTLQKHYDQPILLQENVLEKLLYKARNTIRGKRYSFRTIHSIDQFQAAFPLQSYESLYPFIQRVYQGEADVLWPGVCKYFAMSSGTTSGSSKFIPISQELLYQCHYKGGKDLYTLYVHERPDTKIFSGKNLALGGAHSPHPNSHGVVQGDLSGILTDNMHWLVQYFRALDKQVALLSDWNEKLDIIASQVHRMDIRSLAGIPSRWQLFFDMFLGRHDIECLADIRPFLELMVHGGISMTVYKPYFDKLFSCYEDTPVYMEVYNASEGFFAGSDSIQRDDMLLFLNHGVFYEFIDIRTQEVLTLRDVRIGVPYELVISTCAGMWRYRIGDVIEFTCLAPYRIQVVGRTKMYLNTFGEHVSVSNIEQALSQVTKELNCRIQEYMVGSFQQENAPDRHYRIIERDIAPSDVQLFMQRVDEVLQDYNDDYNKMRTTMLSFPAYTIVSEGSFVRWLEQRGRLGGQAKVPRLVNSRECIDQLCQIGDIDGIDI